MKISKDIVVIDLEATSARDEEGHQENNYIIDVGAVYVDRELEIVDRFSSLVKPRERITDQIAELTGITNEMVEDAAEWDVVARAFQDWIRGRAGDLKKIKLAAWGAYFDIPLLRRLYRTYGLAYPFGGAALDVKSVAFVWQALAGHRTDKASVEHVAGLMGLKPEGAYHRAGVDAEVEARILQRCLCDLNQGAFLEFKKGAPYSLVRLEIRGSERPS